MSAIAAAIGATAVAGLYTANKAAGAAADSTAAQSAAAADTAAIAKERLDFEKQQYADNAGTRTAMSDRAIQISDAQLVSMKQANEIAADYDNYNKTTYRPLEQAMVADAQNYDTAERRSQAASEATAGVEKSYGAAQVGLNQDIARAGGQIGQGGRSLALMQDAALSKAKASAGATSNAVRNVEQQGYARKVDAVSLGKGLAGNQATSQQIATQAGNSSNANMQMALNGTNTANASLGNAYAGAANASTQAGSLYGSAANNYLGMSNSANSALGGLGSAFGNWAGTSAGSTAIAKWLPSSEKLKTDIEPTDNAEALDEVNALKVKDWEYDAAKTDAGSLPGMGGRMTGPMAEDTLATMGESVAPGGQGIDMRQMGGKLVAGVQELTDRIERLEAAPALVGMAEAKRKQKRAALPAQMASMADSNKSQVRKEKA